MIAALFRREKDFEGGEPGSRPGPAVPSHLSFSVNCL